MNERATTADTPALEFTGERFTPECVREIWYEHWHRYAFAAALARGRRVLDAACGEGYGSALLARTAGSVLGVDIAAPAIEHARARYGGVTNLRFREADCTALPDDIGAFDLVVSFETLEHVAAQEALVAGFARALDGDGLLVISSPDKRSYSDRTGFKNEYHVRELYREELLELLGRHFPHVRLYAQKLLFASAIWSLDAAAGPTQAVTFADGAAHDGMLYEPMYYVAVCARSQAAFAAAPPLSLFGDAEETVYRHYNGEVRRNMAAGQRIAELEAQLAARADASAQPAAPRAPAAAPWWRRWSRRRP